MEKEPQIILTGIVKNGRRIYNKPELLQRVLNDLDGRDFEEYITERPEGKTPSQRAYYFGGIIKKTCMESEPFRGWSFDEIDHFFRQKFISYKTTKSIEGIEITFNVVDDISSLSKKKMSEFIDRVIQFLDEHEIKVLSPGEYYYGKYQLPDQKIFPDNDW